MNTRLWLGSLVLLVLLAGGCARDKAVAVPAAPDYARPLGPGESALRLVTDPDRLPDLGAAYDRYHKNSWRLDAALDESERWFQAPSSRNFFPMDGITHEQAAASVPAFRATLKNSRTRQEFVDALRENFDIYESVGYNGEGIVLFTGYYAPVFQASRERTAEFDVPLHTRPEQLVTDPATGEPKGWKRPDGTLGPSPTRAQIQSSQMFTGNELVWLKDSLDAYIIHVNGSAKLRLRDGSVMYVGYAGKTEHPYSSLGRAMVDAGLIEEGGVTLRRIEEVYANHPESVETLMNANESYVFFTEYDESRWPSGSLGVKVTEKASLATDKSVYPRGGVVLVDTDSIRISGGTENFLEFMLDQDTGGAIQAPGRADIYMGQGPTAEILAGAQYAEGRLYYFFLKPEKAASFLADAATGPKTDEF